LKSAGVLNEVQVFISVRTIQIVGSPLRTIILSENLESPRSIDILLIIDSNQRSLSEEEELVLTKPVLLTTLQVNGKFCSNWDPNCVAVRINRTYMSPSFLLANTQATPPIVSGSLSVDGTNLVIMTSEGAFFVLDVDALSSVAQSSDITG
jgi:hypothetical protein